MDGSSFGLPRHRPLLIDNFERTRDIRALFLRDYDIEVEAAEELDEARFVFQS